jgi:hypothetical protein
MQSPIEFVHFLMDEATENGGKVSVVVAILKKFPVVARTSIFRRFIEKIDARNPGKNVSNATVLLKSLAPVWIEQDKVFYFDFPSVQGHLFCGLLSESVVSSTITSILHAPTSLSTKKFPKN